MKARIVLATLAVAVGVSLTGCGGVFTEPKSEPKSEPTNDGQYASVYGKEVQTKDGRTVQCVVSEAYRSGGLSCDWEHAK